MSDTCQTCNDVGFVTHPAGGLNARCPDCASPQPDTAPERWQIVVTVPAHLPGITRESLFEAVSDATHEWEDRYLDLSQRDGWDVDVSGAPAPQPGTAPEGPAERVQAHLDARSHMRGLDSETIETISHHVHGEHALRVDDLRALVAAALNGASATPAERAVIEAVRNQP